MGEVPSSSPSGKGKAEKERCREKCLNAGLPIKEGKARLRPELVLFLGRGEKKKDGVGGRGNCPGLKVTLTSEKGWRAQKRVFGENQRETKREGSEKRGRLGERGMRKEPAKVPDVSAGRILDALFYAASTKRWV